MSRTLETNDSISDLLSESNQSVSTIYEGTMKVQATKLFELRQLLNEMEERIKKSTESKLDNLLKISAEKDNTIFELRETIRNL